MRIAIMGAGNVGGELGKGWARAGHTVVYGVTDPDAGKHAVLAAGGARITTVAEAARDTDAIVLAVPWVAVPDVIANCGPLEGRLILDATNPLAFGAEGLALTLGFSTSGGETVAALAPGAFVFKTMNQVGFAVMSDTIGYLSKPVMFVAGDDASHKAIVFGLVADLGFAPRDAGPLDRSRLLEPYAMLWIEQTMLHGGSPVAAFALLDKEPVS